MTSDASGAGTLTVGQLKSSGPGGLFGFGVSALSDRELTPDMGLHLYDPATGKLIKVSGFDGKPLEPLEWAFVSGTTSIVAQMDDGSFYLIEPLNGSPAQPLGGHSRMYGFVPGSTTLIVDDNGQYKAIDLATGDTSLLPAIDLPEAAALHELLPLGGDRGYVSLAATEAGGSLRYSVAAISDGTIRQIYAEEPAESIESICASPNGQYLAITKVADEAYVHADNFGLPNATEFVDTATGRTDQDVAGANVNWCN